MKKKIFLLAIVSLMSMLSLRLSAVEVKIYGGGGVQANIGEGNVSVKICPEQSNQLCATLIIEEGVIKQIISANSSANRTNVIEVLLEEYVMRFYYQDSMTGTIYGKDVTIEVKPKKEDEKL